jgi:transcriptional regulator with XRE-family HTH domain
VRRGSSGSGINVDPLRVREARREAGLSLAQVARDDISRTFLHFVEHGRSRPSKEVLALIAKRTGRPISYFVVPPAEQPQYATTDLASDLLAVAGRIRREMADGRIDKVDLEAMRFLELTVRQGAELARAVRERSHGPVKARRARTAAKGTQKAS